jgi:hypothetical protein
MHSLLTEPNTPPSATLRMTPFCRSLGLTAPVVQAPVGSASTHARTPKWSLGQTPSTSWSKTSV